MHKHISIIGGGNLGKAIADGLIVSNYCAPSSISVTKRNPGTLAVLNKAGVDTGSDNRAAVKKASVVILAVKPYQAEEVLHEIKDSLDPEKHILISVVTGLWLDDIQEITGKEIAVIRAMPNTAISIRQSMTCLSSKTADVHKMKEAVHLFEQLGKVAVIEEKLMDASTVLGACGIAYALRYIRASIQGGIEIGFDAKTATLIAAQTAKGATELLIQTGHHPEEEIDKVTTPQGCTIAGLNEMEHQGFSSSLIRGIVASYRKIGA